MKKILLSIATVAVVGAVVAGATGAWFTNTETSTGNTFTAGTIDLKIDNESYVTNNEGVLVVSLDTSWEIDDLNKGQLFFDFHDLKPGDVGEDTISIHVGDNDAWACMDINITATPENGQTEPEALLDTTIGADEGELQDELEFVFWKDDGDNVLEDNEDGTFWNMTLQEISDSGTLALADSQGGVLEYGSPLNGGETYFIGKAWCQGELTLDPRDQDNQGKTGSNGPLNRGTGILCDGAPITDISQTDGVVADVSFSVEQSRHNERFQCNPPQEGELTVVKRVVGGTMTLPEFMLYVDNVNVISGEVNVYPSGIHTVTEGNYSDYTAVFSDDCDSSGDVNVPANGSATCTITNTYNLGTLTVNKIIRNNNGGNETESSFNLFVDGSPKTFGASIILSEGAHVVSETGVSGYIGTYGGDCDASGNVTVSASENAICTITNDDIAPNITLIKEVLGGQLGPQDFTLTVNGVTVPSGLSILVDSNFPNIISENPVAGYVSIGITGDPECYTGIATLDEGEAITCTITNLYVGED